MAEKEGFRYNMLVITGPTASGKTSLAAEMAFLLGGEVISADSRQVYRGMNIGTGKDYNDYMAGGKRIPCHLIDIADPGYKYNVFEYQRDFTRVLADLEMREVFPVVCGGSGMYVDAVVSGYSLKEVPPDPVLRSELEKKTMQELTVILASFKKLHNKTDLDSKKRAIRAIEICRYESVNPGRITEGPSVKPIVAGILFNRERRRERISSRLRQRLAEGMCDEVSGLLERGIDPEALIYYGLEYKYITLYLTGRLTYDEMFRSLEIAIHQYAKRQMTWFRGMERKGVDIHWIDGELSMQEKTEAVMALLRS